MNSYIFLTRDGMTYSPIENDMIPIETENLQVLGFEDGKTAELAFIELIRNNPYLKELGFDDVICYKLDKDYEKEATYYSLRLG